MKFIMLNKTDGNQVAVSCSSIVSVEIHDEETTWVGLSNGTKFSVVDLAEDILEAIKVEFVKI